MHSCGVGPKATTGSKVIKLSSLCDDGKYLSVELLYCLNAVSKCTQFFPTHHLNVLDPATNNRVKFPSNERVIKYVISVSTGNSDLHRRVIWCIVGNTDRAHC